MAAHKPWPVAAPIVTARLTLEPLRVEHAEEMAPLLDDQRLHEFIGGQPATLEGLRSRYAAQVVGHSSNGDEGWLNWIVRLNEDGVAVGTVQATVHRQGNNLTADVAWVIATAYQRQGYAAEAAEGMVGWLRGHDVETVSAYIHPEHTASIRIAQNLGLAVTDETLDGEIRWSS